MEKRRPMWKEPAAVVVLCNDCDAEKPCDRLWIRVDVQTPQGVAAQNLNQLDLGDWTEGIVRPKGKPVLVHGGVQVDFAHDSPEAVATKTQADQHVFRCPACSTKARDREVLESAGLRVETGGAL